jgi:ADP-ribose pyrophosphatase YjhB (NUDIX family)
LTSIVFFDKFYYQAILPDRQEDTMFRIADIPDSAPSPWKIEVNGEAVNARHVRLASKFGELEYGMRPEGYPGWAFREAGGGGSVTLPWCKDTNGDILIGLRLEDRKNMGGEALCIIGGFKEPEETHRQAQERELAEEAGLSSTNATPELGLPACSNRLFFVANPHKGEGVHGWHLQIPFEWLELSHDKQHYRLKTGVQDANLPKPELIHFYPWREAVKHTADALAGLPICRLLAAVL